MTGVTLRRNLSAGVASSVWSAVLGLAVVPFYLRFLGLEAYGLIGFFASLQLLLQVLDLGLAPTINREVARAASSGDVGSVRNLFRTLSTVYWVIGVLIAAVCATAAPFIARHWLQSSGLSVDVVSQAIILMGLVIACRWPVGLYTGVVTGVQRLATVSLVNAIIATLGSIGAIFVLAIISPTIQAFFIWQAIVGVLHLIIMRLIAWRIVGTGPNRFDLDELRKIWRFSAGLGGVSILGIVLMQADKVILSRLVSLEALGLYTLAGLLARSLYLFLTPVFSAVFPRMSALVARDDTPALIELYRSGTRLLLAVIFPIAVFVSVFSAEIFQIWIGGAAAVEDIRWVVMFLMAGTALNGAMHFPYALQLAYGQARLPLVINTILVVALLPLLVLLTVSAGIVGAAAAWALLNVVYLFLGTWLTHRTLLNGTGRAWLLTDVGLPLIVALLIVGGGGLAMRTLNVPIFILLGAGASLAAVASLLIMLGTPQFNFQLRKLLVPA